jgi:YtkA-like
MVKSKFLVIGLGAFLCCVPALVFFLFRNQNDTLGSYTLKTQPTTAWPLEQQDEKYRIILTPVSSNLKRGKQRLKLRIESLQSTSTISALPEVHILMPMGKDTMTAPATAQKLEQAGRYQLQTQFDMAGDWELDVRPDPASKLMQFHFWVQM